MNPSETPRTDQAFVGDASVGLLPEIENWGEAAEFARRLERDLNAMTRERDGYRMSYDGAAEALRIYRARLDSAIAGEAHWKTRWASEVDELRRQLRKTTCRDCGAQGPLIGGQCAGCSDADEADDDMANEENNQ